MPLRSTAYKVVTALLPSPTPSSLKAGLSFLAQKVNAVYADRFVGAADVNAPPV